LSAWRPRPPCARSSTTPFPSPSKPSTSSRCPERCGHALHDDGQRPRGGGHAHGARRRPASLHRGAPRRAPDRPGRTGTGRMSSRSPSATFLPVRPSRSTCGSPVCSRARTARSPSASRSWWPRVTPRPGPGPEMNPGHLSLHVDIDPGDRAISGRACRAWLEGPPPSSPVPRPPSPFPFLTALRASGHSAMNCATLRLGLSSDSRMDGRCLPRHEVQVIYFRTRLTGRRRSRSPVLASAAECQGENFEVFREDAPGLRREIGPLVGTILGGTSDAATSREPRST